MAVGKEDDDNNRNLHIYKVLVSKKLAYPNEREMSTFFSSHVWCTVSSDTQKVK